MTMRVQASSPGGGMIETYELEFGDIVDWKRYGEKGLRRARVSCAAAGAGKVRIRPLFNPEAPGSVRERWIKVDRIQRVYDSNGKNKMSVPS